MNHHSTVFWEDVQEGQEIPTQIEKPGSDQLAKWAGAVGNYHKIHYDKDFAIADGWPNIVTHGPLKTALLIHYMTDWIGDGGWLKKLGGSHRAPSPIGDTLYLKGKVTRKYEENGETLVDCEVWIENQDGRLVLPGQATVALPARKNPGRVYP